MSGSTYYSKFVFTSTGLKGILEEFKMVAGQIEAQSVALGKMNFAGLNSSLPVLKNIDNTLLLMAEHMNLLSSAGAKVAAPFNQVSAGAAKAATSVKSVSTSMGQLATLSGTASSAAGKVTSSLSTLGAAGKTAFSGIVSGAERAVGALGAVSAAAMTATKAVTRMGALASLPMAGLKTMSSAVTGSMIAQSAGMLLNPMNSVPLAAGYGLYTYGNVQKAASEAAAKSWKPGMTQAQKDDIKKNVESISRQLAGQTVYSPTDYAKVAADYAGMGGDVSSQGGYNAKLAKLMGQYSQAINSPDIGTALEPLLSSNLVWYGGDTKKAGSYEAIKKSGDLRAMAVAQTKLQGKDLSDLLKDWEPVAKAYGQDQYQSTALVAGLAQLGLKPQQAGMAARRIALRGTPNLSSAQKMDAISLGLMDEDGNSVDESGLVIKDNEDTMSLQQFGMNYGDLYI